MEIKGRSKVKVSSSCFPEDVVVEILSRLPVKSLLRFKCVSKEWKALIESTYFTAIHLQNSDPKLSLLAKFPQLTDENSIRLLRNESTLLSLDLPLLNPSIRSIRWLYPVGSSNGLVCLALYSSDGHHIVIWNPATKQFKYHHLLPPRYHLLGFEYFHDTRDYKVVGIILPRGSDDVFRAKVFTSSTDSWREVSANNCSLQGVSLVTHPYGNTTLNGVLYLPLRTQERRPTVLSFNLRAEVFYVTPLPERINQINALFSWKNSLALIAGQEDEQRELWMMTEEPYAGTTQMSWVKQLIIKSSSPLRCIVGSWKDEYLLGYDSYKDLHCYHPASQKLTKVLQHDQKHAYFYLKAFNYVESLVSVD